MILQDEIYLSEMIYNNLAQSNGSYEALQTEV